MHIAYITAGGAGMFCGSCMQDNALARALMQQDCEVSLIPTYTPIRVDQENVSQKQVFLGGINLYLDQLIPGWRFLPRSFVSWLDHPRLIAWATSLGIENNAAKLGHLTLQMLGGGETVMRREYNELVRYLVALKPDVILFTNALLSGVLPLLRPRFNGPIVCLLQGDDLFLDQLLPTFQQQARELITKNSAHFDRFVTHSQFYAHYMSEYLNLPLDKFDHLPLAIDMPLLPPLESLTDATPTSAELLATAQRPFRIGYFARIAPEKGLLQLVEAVNRLHAQQIPVELHAGGYLGSAHQAYFQQITQAASPLGDRFRYIGSPATQAEKFAFLKTLDAFSVPACYQEPKGLYALEAMANGVPVVLPEIGSLPELVASNQGGLTYPAGDITAHAARLQQLYETPLLRQQLAQTGRLSVPARHTSAVAAQQLLRLTPRWLKEKHQTPD